MRKITRVCTFLFVFAGISGAAAAQAVIGSVVRCAGTCIGVNDGTAESLTGGMDVYLMETVTTGAGGRLELRFPDGTRLMVGEKAEIVLDAFVFDPSGASRFHATITGPFRFISGKLNTGATRDASVTTPFALIGVRGTDFWGGTLNGVAGVVVLEGVVSVTTDAGSVVLSATGEGTNLTARNAPPSPVSRWSQARIAVSLASVAFQ